MTYNLQTKKLVTTLKSVNRISITTDLWKSGQKSHYMVVTGHFINDDWKLQKRVLNFCYVPPPHSGVVIVDALFKCITGRGIKNKVASITVNNVSYNDLALKNLQGTFKLLKKKLPFDGSEYPISNLFLTEVWRIKEILDKSTEDSDDCIRLMAIRMKLKFDKYWGECNLLTGLGVILDPRYKMVRHGFCFPLIYNDSLLKVSQLKDSLYELYNEYVAMYSQAYNELILQQSTTEVGSLNSASLGRKVVMGRSEYESFIRQSDSIQPVKSDLDIYLEEGVYICQQGMDSQFDALEWWKANSLKYRILSKMARDILSIPITSVASESTFSAGSRVIDPYRASLATETVEMLLCGADWVRAHHGLKKGSDVVAVLQIASNMEMDNHFWRVIDSRHFGIGVF
ncbi:hypothetical protein RHMOL_Rhmol05G0127400 [Rhododendron molle]|uniref:Uncharacterized protein n=1 Tax=Rhododendron molle TaxID=49168 RepID=A0ACC0NQF6_RHOML|nr:hypothetical protein RHMOL_Rhmol05G0127400 [Rhododendron molle]